ncbi:MAG: insulinase family protein [Oscillospiraceae bacterium]|nr:insulinase family protein [Oscillospiraceae bacterium]
MESLKINDNINLYYVPMKKLKTTSIGVYIHRALSADEASKNAVLPYVMKRGCKLCPDSSAVAKYLENLYGASLGTGILKRGDDHIIYFGFETISDKYAPDKEPLTADGIKLMMSVLFEPDAFDDETVMQEKKNASDRITAEMNDKRQYAQLRCSEEMCKGESFALSRLGTKEGVEAITADELRKHYEKIITSSAMDIYVCGDADINALGEEIKKYTSKLNFEEANIVKTSIFEGHGDVKRITDNMDVVQGKLSMGFRTGVAADSADYVPLMVTNSIFGGGAHSKLFNNVREKLSLCYYASSSTVRNKGIMFVNAGIEFQNFEKAYDEILVQLDNVKKGDISDLEFESSVNALINELESYNDDQNAIQFFYLSEKIAGTNYNIDELKDKISRVTIEDVKRVASNIELDTVYFLTGKEG